MLTHQKGFSVSYALVSSVRSAPPPEREVKDLVARRVAETGRAKTPSGAGLLLTEDFEKVQVGALPESFQASGPSSRAVRELEGNKVLEVKADRASVEFGRPGWADYEVEVKVRFERAPSRVALILRHDPATGKNYQLELRPNRAALVRSLNRDQDDPNEVSGSEIRPGSGQWHRLRGVCRGELIDLYMDDKLVLRSRETLSPAGRCKLYSAQKGVFFDDLTVRKAAP